LYYWKDGAVDDSLFSVAIERDPSVVVRQPELVLAMDFGSSFDNWDVHPDGERFLVTVNEESGAAADGGEPSQTRFLVVLNWFEELRARVGN
jgi:hypothetical protein